MGGGSGWERKGDGGDCPGMDHLAAVALALLLGGSVIALVGQRTAAQAGPAIVLSLLLAALAAALVLFCLHALVQRLPAAAGLHGLLAATWGRPLARLLCAGLLLELVATAAGAAQAGARHLQWLLAGRGIDACGGLPVPAIAAIGLLVLGAIALLPPRRVALVACALLTIKIGVGVLLFALAARYVHYAHWVPWLPEATAPYRFGPGGVLAATVPLLGVFASAGLALGFPGLRQRTATRQPRVLAAALLLAMLLLIVLAALQAGLVEFPALASTRPLSVALQGHPQLQWMQPLLPLAGAAGLAALQLVLLLLAMRLATALRAPDREEGDGYPARSTTAMLTLLAALLALGLPTGSLPALPGPVGLLVMVALCLGVLRTPGQGDEASSPLRRTAMVQVLAPLAAAVCLLPAVQQVQAWAG